MARYLVAAVAIAALLQLGYMKEAAAADAPKIEFDNKSHDFGTINQYTANDHIFKFKNTGTATLKIESVHPSCGCTAAVLSDSSIEPGKTGEIKSTFNSGDFSGEVHKTIDVATNDPANKQVRLDFKANILANLVCTPMRLDFGDIGGSDQAPQTLSVKLFSPSGKKFTVVAAKPSVDYIVSEIAAPEKDNGEYAVRVKIAGAPPSGGFTGSVVIQTDIEKVQPVTVMVTGNVRSKTEITPPKLFFGPVCVGAEADNASRELTVRANSWNGLKVEKVETPASLAATVEEVKKGKEWKVSVRIKGPVQPGVLKEKVKLLLNDPTMKEVEVQVFALLRDCK